MSAYNVISRVSPNFFPTKVWRDETQIDRGLGYWPAPRRIGAPSTDTASMLRSTLRGEIRGVWESVKRDGWNGEGACAVSAGALAEALKLADAIPASVDAPTVSAEADGYITFEWYRSKERQLSISIGGTHILYFAGRIGEHEPTGQVQFWDTWPVELNEHLRAILAS